MILAYDFYARPACQVAQDLLGKILVHQWQGERLAGRIVETEAYCDAAEPDLACHGSRNNGRPTPRTAVMFGPPGHSYVYFTYGMHWLFNIVTGQPGQANAVLIRAVEPTEGEIWMREHRAPRPRPQWTNGPAKLTQALALNQSHNGLNLCTADGVIWVEDAPILPPAHIHTGPRIGLGQTPEPWLSIPWRYWVAGNPFVSKGK